jgi:hypothetical protein
MEHEGEGEFDNGIMKKYVANIYTRYSKITKQDKFDTSKYGALNCGFSPLYIYEDIVIIKKRPKWYDEFRYLTQTQTVWI